MSNMPPNILKAPAKVLACLRPGYLTVFIGYGLGMADGGVPHDFPIDAIPFDLRLPNSQFMLVFDQTNGQIIGVERHADEEQTNPNSGTIIGA